MNCEKKVQAFIIYNGTLNATGVMRKLCESRMSTETIFLAWSLWKFDVSHLKDWLQEEKLIIFSPRVREYVPGPRAYNEECAESKIWYPELCQ